MQVLSLALRAGRSCSWDLASQGAEERWRGDGPWEQSLWAGCSHHPGSSILILQPALEVEVLKSCTELFAWYFLPPRTGSSSEAQEGAALGRIPASHILIPAYRKRGKLPALSLIPVASAGS